MGRIAKLSGCGKRSLGQGTGLECNFIRLPLVEGCGLSVGSAPLGKFSNRTSNEDRPSWAAAELFVDEKEFI